MSYKFILNKINFFISCIKIFAYLCTEFQNNLYANISIKIETEEKSKTNKKE